MSSKIEKNLDPVRRKWDLFRLFTKDVPEGSFWDSLEEILISGDSGVGQTEEILRRLRQRLSPFGRLDHGKALLCLSEILCDRLMAVKGTGDPVRFGLLPTVVLLLGVNGSGKTTTAAKLAWNLNKEGKKGILAAADTFRAAAAEQLKNWGQKADTRVIAHAPGGDPGAVVFDALQAAKADKADYIIIDTAGRLHTRSNLMEELVKIYRIIERNCQGWTIESLLVIDAVTGQNGFRQAESFGEAIPLTGAVITKYDHTAKGGIILSAGSDLGLPVRYVGLGERIEDLELFDPDLFVKTLLGIGSGSDQSCSRP